MHFLKFSKKGFSIVILFTGISLPVWPQNPGGKSSLSIEFMGVAQTVSVNYERVLIHKSIYFLNGRLGLGLEAFLRPGIPHGITLCFGKKNSFFETGLLSYFGPTTFGYADTKRDNWYYLAPVIGYRRQKSKAVLLKIYICLLVPFNQEYDLAFLPGLGVGYTF